MYHHRGSYPTSERSVSFAISSRDSLGSPDGLVDSRTMTPQEASAAPSPYKHHARRIGPETTSSPGEVKKTTPKHLGVSTAVSPPGHIGQSSLKLTERQYTIPQAFSTEPPGGSAPSSAPTPLTAFPALSRALSSESAGNSPPYKPPSLAGHLKNEGQGPFDVEGFMDTLNDFAGFDGVNAMSFGANSSTTHPNAAVVPLPTQLLRQPEVVYDGKTLIGAARDIAMASSQQQRGLRGIQQRRTSRQRAQANSQSRGRTTAKSSITVGPAVRRKESTPFASPAASVLVPMTILGPPGSDSPVLTVASDTTSEANLLSPGDNALTASDVLKTRRSHVAIAGIQKTAKEMASIPACTYYSEPPEACPRPLMTSTADNSHARLQEHQHLVGRYNLEEEESWTRDRSVRRFMEQQRTLFVLHLKEFTDMVKKYTKLRQESLADAANSTLASHRIIAELNVLRLVSQQSTTLTNIIP